MVGIYSMEFALVARFIRLSAQLIGMALFLASAQIAYAQSIQLTPEQQRMLNALPPAQRAQAEAAIRQIQTGSQKAALQPLSETTDEAPALTDGEQSFAVDDEDELRAAGGSRTGRQ